MRFGNGKTAAAAGVSAMGITGGWNNGISSLWFHFFLVERGGGTPTPGGFWQRVRKPLKRKGLRILAVQKSAQEIEKKEDRSKNVGTFEGLKVGTLKRKRLTVPTGSGSSIES